MMKLGGYCTKISLSSNVKVKGQGHRGKNEKNADSSPLTMFDKATRALQAVRCTQQEASP